MGGILTQGRSGCELFSAVTLASRVFFTERPTSRQAMRDGGGAGSNSVYEDRGLGGGLAHSKHHDLDLISRLLCAEKHGEILQTSHLASGELDYDIPFL